MALDLPALITTSVSLLLLILVGFVLRKIGLLDERFTKNLSTLVAKGALPFMILHSVTRLEYSAENMKNGLMILVFGTLAHVFMALMARIVFSRVKDADEKKIYNFASVFSNCAFIGFPILEALFGEIGLFYGAFYVITYNLGCWSYGAILMSKGKEGEKFTVKNIFLNIGTISCGIAFVLYVCRVPIPSFLMTTMGHMGSLCTPLSLLVTGSLVAAMPLKNVFLNPKLYAFCGFKLLFLPLAAALILHFTGASVLVTGIDLTVFLAVMIALPSAAFTSLFANMYDVKPSYAAQLVSLATMLSPLTILAVMGLLQLLP